MSAGPSLKMMKRGGTSPSTAKRTLAERDRRSGR